MARDKAGGHDRTPALLVPGWHSGRGKVCVAPASLSSGVTPLPPRSLLTPVLTLRPLSTQSDTRLVELIRAGNERAFETLARRYRRQLLIYADRLAGADGRAEDVLQQSLM